MENKNVGWIIIGISFLIVVIIFLFNNAMKEIVVFSCGEAHSSVCPMNTTINQQTYLSLGIVGVLIIIGLVIMFSKPQKEVIVKKVKQRPKKKIYDTKGLKSEEKKVFNLVKSNKAIFQANIIEETGFGKAKMSRILDKLENKGFVERKRRGMTNIVVLKED